MNKAALFLMVAGSVVLVGGVYMFSPGLALVVAGTILMLLGMSQLDVGDKS